TSGLALLPGAVVMGLSSPITGRVFDKFGARWLALAGTTIVMVTTFMYAGLTTQTSFAYIAIVNAVRMFGTAMVLMPATTAALNELPQRLIPHGTAMNNTMRQVAASVGTAVLVTVMTNSALDVETHGPEGLVHGVNVSFLVAGVVAVLAIALSFLIRPVRPREPSTCPLPGAAGRCTVTGWRHLTGALAGAGSITWAPGSHTIGHMAEGTSHVPPTRGPVRTVSVLDVPLTRVGRPIDLLMMLATIAGLVAVFVLSVAACRATAAVALDVQSVSARVLRSLLLIPVHAIEGFVTLILPIVIVVQQLIQRQVRAVVDALTAAVAAILITAGLVWVLENLTPDAMVRALVLYELSGTVMTISMMVAGLAAFLTGTGTKDERRLVSISWNLLWIVLVVSVIAGKSTLAGALVSVLLGRAVGLGTRYA